MKDLEKQLSEGGMSAHEMEKSRRKLEAENADLMQQLQVRIYVVSLYAIERILHSLDC